jgi:hypothetical protein
MKTVTNSHISGIIKWLSGLSLPWVQIVGELIKLSRKLFRGSRAEGMYTVLDYRSTLELKDKQGKRAVFWKREKVRYLQNNIIAHQDQAWGDGKILVNYHCSPGVAVDKYRIGYKTHVLISLHEVKNKGDELDFTAEWGIQNGFLRPDGFWATEISHLTRHVRVEVIFPRLRPPHRAVIFEKNRQKTHLVMGSAIDKLPDGRFRIMWEKNRPRLYEQYILRWDW